MSIKRTCSMIQNDDDDDDDEEEEEEQEQENQCDSNSISGQVERCRRSLPLKGVVQLECRVCSAPAHGYNFDQISCESCKAFFRRNALRQTSQLKCRYSGRCEITIESRRQCTYCRLKKCFDVKMRKEWIRTEEERQLRELKKIYKKEKNFEKHSQINLVERKKNRLCSTNNLCQDVLTLNLSRICSLNRLSMTELTIDEHSLINNVHHSYDRSISNCFRLEMENYSSQRSTLIEFLNDEKEMYRSLIDFYKQIPQFRRIDLEDQILLIKCNLTHLIHLHHVLKDHFNEPKQFAPLMSQWINPTFHQQMSKTRQYYNYFSSNPILLKLILVVFIFTMNLSRLTDFDLNNHFHQPDILIENQYFFLNLFIKYLTTISDEHYVQRSIQILVFQYLRYQTLMNQMDSFVYQTFQPEQFHPLSKSVLRLT